MLENVFKFIDSVRDEIALAQREHRGNPEKLQALDLVLIEIRSLLDEGRHCTREAKIKQALKYIETIPVYDRSLFFPQSISFGKYLRAVDGLPTCGGGKLKPCLMEPVNHSFRIVLGRIHVSLVEHLQKIAWTYSYPLNQDQQEVLNQEIKAWKFSARRPPAGEEKGLQDILRDIRVDRRECKSNDEAKEKIKNLVARAYDYAEHHRILIQSYIEKNGQDLNRFINLFANHGHFCDIENQEAAQVDAEISPLKDAVIQGNPIIGKAECYYQGWQIVNGKCSLEISYGIKTLNFGPGPIILRSAKTGRVDKYEDQGEELSAYAERPNKNIPTILHVGATVELRINKEGIVEPAVTRCDVSSYSRSPVLKSPARLAGVQNTAKAQPVRFFAEASSCHVSNTQASETNGEIVRRISSEPNLYVDDPADAVYCKI